MLSNYVFANLKVVILFLIVFCSYGFIVRCYEIMTEGWWNLIQGFLMTIVTLIIIKASS